MMEDETLVLYAYVSCSPYNVMYRKLMKADTSIFYYYYFLLKKNY